MAELRQRWLSCMDLSKQFNSDVFVFVEQTCVVHLPGDRSDLSGRWLLEIQQVKL
jgi:hypothetical protein